MTTDGVLDVVRDVLRVTDGVILGYFLLINTSYLILIALATVEFARHVRRAPLAGFEETYRSPLTQAISVVVPAYNEEVGIVESVQAMLALRYPAFEVVVVDDGSTDATFERLAAEFDLVEVPRVIPDAVPTRGAVRSVHVPRLRPEPLVVVRKENSGRADALNVGINAARSPLVCMVDADSLLDPQSLLSVAKPFVDDPLRVVAAGGVVRIANGSSVVAGRIVETRMPRGWLPRIQVVEYLRAFLLGRTGWSRLSGLLVISGAFGLFRRDVLLEVGGLDPDSIGEDAELVVRLHQHLRRARRDYRIVFVAEPVSWTEAPSTRSVLASQRRRWHRGLSEIMTKHRRMIGNPRYGRIGLVALPYYLVFELLAPLVELAGLVLVPLGFALGAVDFGFAWRFVLVAYGYAMLINLVALAVEEYTFHRYSRWRDLAAAVAASILENMGYRQLTAVWRVQGAWSALLRRRHEWGVMTRTGFGGPPTSD
ncbi:Glycosyltransferase, catalytic subunit of cellulose synthase and poly-beta-1,6-N-acetylglucosamine synthase [Micromonospora pattaloongensis]|uniref:Glycosyltransferase, catalytic subunit of cellulose synthase and poly-beta-1,6-N-acetylglucosamine synthase n=1 Tax=Micromonospora pattaloongensis TaxID=405436 RepID=A0A1H3QD01_9ACTN|nr:glycosyltransferase [Micromonospora pattaloongensis]SDZ11412.1 Glycosyltransferase, catalytic subunit of cellulose synthase and poly-beta-1,6-N-acetylglucosamine synthase [Micromonospora pattaloongensis]